MVKDDNSGHRRDIELILFGVALEKASRERVLSAFSPGSFSKETERLLQSLRSNNAEPMAEWMDQRGVMREKGQDYITAMIQSVLDDNRRQKVKDACRKLAHTNTTEDLDSLVSRLETVLGELKELQ